MASFTIKKEDLHSLSGKVVVLTGDSPSQRFPSLADADRWLGEKTCLIRKLATAANANIDSLVSG